MQTHIIQAPAMPLTGAIDVPGTEEDVDLYGEDLEPLTPEELAEMEAEIAAYRRAEERDAEREAATARQGMRENILLEYGTPENYYHAVGCSGDEDYIAKLFGLGKNFLEPKNIRRRADGRRATFQKQTKAHQMKGFAPASPVATPKVSAPKEVLTVPQQKAVAKAVARRDARQVVRDFYADAMKAHPKRAEKLQRSLEFQFSQYDATLERLTGRGKTEAEAVAVWERAARAAMEAKITK